MRVSLGKHFLFLIFWIPVSYSNAADVPSVPRLDDESVYSVMQVSHDSSVAYSYWVKFAILLDEAGEFGEIAYQNTREYPFHWEYLATRPEFKGLPTSAIQQLTLYGKNRKALLGTVLIRYGNLFQGVDTDIEIISEDSLDPKLVRKVFDRLKETVDLKLRYRYLPVPRLRQEVSQSLEAYKRQGIEVIFPEAPSRNIYYVSTGTVGAVRRMTADEAESAAKAGELSPTDILVLDSAPADLTPVAGIIVGTQTPPSSHAVLLARSLNIPFIYERGAFENPRWKDLEGKLIYLEAPEFSLAPILAFDISDRTLNHKARLLDARKLKIATQPTIDESVRQVVDLGGGEHSASVVGGKGANLAKLMRLIPDNAPKEVLDIPVYFFEEYLRTAQMRNGRSLAAFVSERETQLVGGSAKGNLYLLKEIRDAIKDTPIPGPLLRTIREALVAKFGTDPIRIKLRSSSNVEDGSQFNGAGLYESAGICLADSEDAKGASACDSTKKPDPLSKGLRKVWRSLFLPRAYFARELFGVDQARVSMAVVAHPSYQRETANGVAIHANRWGHELNVTGFPGEELTVTHPPVGKIPETMKIRLYQDEIYTTPIVRCSELPTGQELLTAAQYKTLMRLTKTVFDAWSGTDVEKRDLELDFEWKRLEDGQIIIKQVREVPQPTRQSKFDPDDALILTHSNLRFIPELGEQPHGLWALQSKLEIEFDAGVFSIREGLEGKIPFERIRVRGREGFIHEISVQDAKPQFIVEPWKEIRDYVGSDEGAVSGAIGQHREQVVGRERNVVLKLELANPEIPGLVFELGFHQQEKGGAMTSARIMAADFVRAALKAPSRSILSWKMNEPFGDTLYWQAIAQDMSVPDRQVDSSQLFANDKIVILLESTRDAFDTAVIQKTLFRNMKLVTIDGLLDQPLVIENPNAMVYAPAHHNFSWEYALDLFHAKGITQEQVRQLSLMGGRYLVLSSNGEDSIAASLWDAKGESTEIALLKNAGPGAFFYDDTTEVAASASRSERNFVPASASAQSALAFPNLKVPKLVAHGCLEQILGDGNHQLRNWGLRR